MDAANVHCIHELVAAGANVNARDGDSEIALLIVASAGRTDCVKALIKAKANVSFFSEKCGPENAEYYIINIIGTKI